MTPFDRALAHHTAGRLAEAEALYAELLKSDPGHVEGLHLLGVIQHQRGRHEAAVALIGEAIRLKPDYADAHCNLAAALRALGRLNPAIQALATALRLAPDHPEALTNLAVVTRERHGLDAAIACFRQALAAAPVLAEAWNGLANALRERGLMDDAIAAFQRARALKPGFAAVHGNLGNTLLGVSRLDEAAAAYGAALALDPDQAEPLVGQYSIALALCDFARVARLRPAIERLAAERPVTSWRPLGAIAYRHLFRRLPEPIHRAMEQRIADMLGASPAIPRPLRPAGGRPPGGQIRLGFLSTNFGNHAVGQVAADLFGALDPARFELHAFSRWDRSGEPQPYHRRMRPAFTGFHEVAALPPPEIARRIAEAGIDILVDLHGYMDWAGPEILALRPAPVQAFWLGHAGGLAVGACDYLIADRITVPPGEEGRYRQAVVRLPDIYHCASPHPIAPDVPTRAECGLPDQGFVFCAFNNPEKIDETAFAAWMAILGDVPGSVLWLSDPGSFASRHGNLRAAAAGHGIDPARLVFAGWTPDKDTHLARHAHAGLLLDTVTLNASTTALDALWSGCPVLTLRGQDFASRIAETMLRAVGLDEMVCADLVAYHARAVTLARDPVALEAVKARLAANRVTHALFDVNRFARYLGAAFARMWEMHRAGEAARGFDVSGSERP